MTTIRPSKYTQKVFPIKTETACQLKWTWSTIYLASEMTASCHRTNHHYFDTDTFDFHNTPEKLSDREHMINGQWPERGCQYCRNIEEAGGQSDRITNLDFPGVHAPEELNNNPTAINVTPRILEVYFDNTCNLKCVYCGSYFSSLWDAENRKFGAFNQGGVNFGRPYQKSTNLESNKQKLFDWLKQHRSSLTLFNILGGEPLYQKELEQCLDLFDQFPAPELKLQIFTNLNTNLIHLQKIISKIKNLIDTNKLREFEVTASLDCWGREQEYVRYPLDLISWEENFNYLLSHSWINIIVSSTITPLTIKTLPDLLEKIKGWNQVRKIYHYQNSVVHPDYMFIDMFGDIFTDDFNRAINLKPQGTPEEDSSRDYLKGIAQQAASREPNINKITDLFVYLNELDRRRNTNWRQVFPWLVSEFAKYNLI